ncbi:MAG: type IV toxin-antitoxin system AbiEi family antitoxin [Bacteroidales bacterium]|nr:type IV toxin-antitoxin system AbiEi family antitoxin [Bacteroidales bacterium]
MEKDNIIHTAIENLNEATAYDVYWDDDQGGAFDGIITIKIKDRHIAFAAEVKQEFRLYQIEELLNRKRGEHPLMIIATKLFPKIKEHLKAKNIAYLEASGNAFIKQNDLLILIEGQKPIQKTKIRPNRAFTKTAVKLLFLFLTDEEWLNRPYREIAKMAGIALGAIPIIINALQDLGFIVKVDEKRYMLANKEELLKRWITAYGEKLKPGIRLGKFVVGENTIKNWKEIPLQVEDTVWGGEPAADILTDYLDPERFTLYTKLKTADLIKNYRIIPEKNGQVEIFEMFWKLDTEKWDTAPPLIVYADLMNTDDSRNIEVAKIIYERYLKDI